MPATNTQIHQVTLLCGVLEMTTERCWQAHTLVSCFFFPHREVVFCLIDYGALSRQLYF